MIEYLPMLSKYETIQSATKFCGAFLNTGCICQLLSSSVFGIYIY